jgi:CheY-like chemotaxis protein
MEYVPLGFAGLLGSAYLLCSAAEFLLWLFECEPLRSWCSRKTQPIGQESGRLNAPPLENPGPVPRPSSQAVTSGKPGILIADDHRLYRRLLETWFREHGFTVWVAADGREAVRLHQAHAKEISVALLDVHMPDLDGPGSLAALRQDGASIPCCFMTTNLTRSQEAQLLALGAAGVFEKPLLLREATAVISALITGRGRLRGEHQSPTDTNRGDP